MCQETIDWFEKKCFPYALESENPARESIKWLKSLKYRIQPKQEWSKKENTLKPFDPSLGRDDCYHGGPCTNPYHDCINCPRIFSGNGTTISTDGTNL